MPTFQESDLNFTFPDDWAVRQFDQTPAYQSLSGHGLKGVDFIAISPDGRLWLIEVKNYRPRFKAEREYRATRRSPADLADHVARKFSDSFRLIRIVGAHLMRSWFRRLSVWYRLRVRPNPASNYWFWSRANTFVPEAVVYVLWMETPERKQDYDRQTASELAKRLPVGAVVIVTESTNPPGLPFEVSR